MFEALKGMFTPEVDFVDFKEGLLLFKAAKRLKADTTRVRLKMSFGKVAANIAIQSVDDAAGLYRAKLDNYEVVLENLHDDRRCELRLPRCLKVTSPALPDGRGTTEDISLKGARLLTGGLLEKDAHLSLEIELDHPEPTPINLTAHVLWSAQKVDGEGYHSGLKFLDLDRQQIRTIVRYVNERLALERKLHTQG